MADLDPAGGGLAFGERRTADGRELAGRGSLNAETVPLPPAPSWALETNSWSAFVGLNSLPNGPTPCAGNGEPAAAVSRPSPPTVKLSISELLISRAHEPRPVAVEQDVARLRAVGQADRRTRDVAARGRRGGGGSRVVAVAVAGVGHVHQVPVDRDADGQPAAGGDDAAGHPLSVRRLGSAAPRSGRSRHPRRSGTGRRTRSGSRPATPARCRAPPRRSRTASPASGSGFRRRGGRTRRSCCAGPCCR